MINGDVEDFRKKLQKKAQSLHAALKELRTRYGMRPPPELEEASCALPRSVGAKREGIASQ